MDDLYSYYQIENYYYYDFQNISRSNHTIMPYIKTDLMPKHKTVYSNIIRIYSNCILF